MFLTNLTFKLLDLNSHKMKKILSLTLIFFFGTTYNLNAQDLYNYYDIYKIENNGKIPRNTGSELEDNSKIFKNNQQNFNDIKYFSQEPTVAKNSFNNNEYASIEKKSNSRTVGNYIGIDFINTHLRYRNIGYNPNSISQYTLPKYKNSFGVKYFYAINYNRIFLAPEIFFEYNNIKKYFDGRNSSIDDLNERLTKNFGYRFMRINKIFGSKINFGYDVTPNFSPFLFAGLSRIYYSNLDSVYTLSGFQSRYDVINATGKDPFSIIHKSKNVPFFGFGSKIKLSNHFSISAEYLIYKNFIAKTNGFKNKDYNHSQTPSDYVEFDNKLRIVKLGLLYNF